MPTGANRILIVNVGGIRFGAIVDGVRNVEWIPESRVEREVPMATLLARECFSGIATLEGEMVILLEMGGLLSASEQAHLAQVGQEKIEKIGMLPQVAKAA